ncbi:segregation/condensation protein A [Oligoflexia bacterium]|nr:segregation/condensation protein A [Oligoflexia bacterium]
MGAVDSFEEYPHFFHVKLELFDGPIDLLLHLVKINELAIEKVALAEVTDQYLKCLENAQRFDLEVAGEYLVIAATLLSIKSSILLQEPVEFIEDENGALIDPHEELLRRLRAAQVYQDGAKTLGARGLFGIDVFPGAPTLKHVKGEPIAYKDHNPLLLGQAFQKLLKEAGENVDSVYTVALESVSIVERMMEVLEQLRETEGAVAFQELVPDLTSKASIIGTFIALLELCKRQVITVLQTKAVQDRNQLDEIVIALSVDDLDMLKLNSEFDVTSSVTDAVQGEIANA